MRAGSGKAGAEPAAGGARERLVRGQAQPPSGWALALNIGTFAAIAVAAGAGSVVARFRRGTTAMADLRVRRGYGITVGIEAAACGLGAAGLALAGHSGYIAPWILLVGLVYLVAAGLWLDRVMFWLGYGNWRSRRAAPGPGQRACC